jgi:cyclophilin family peptidyl-prolyl cis-trans isomerase
MPNQTAVMDTARGTMEIELYPDEVPNTVANFEKLANAGFYDGTKFHRVIANFMIQGGDPYSKSGKGPVGTGGPGYTIKCETSRNVHQHVAGTLDGSRRRTPAAVSSSSAIHPNGTSMACTRCSARYQGLTSCRRSANDELKLRVR